MLIESFVFFGVIFAILLAVAWRNGVFQRRSEGGIDGRGAYPQIQPGGRSGESIRDPRAKLDAGDRLGRR